MSRGGAVVIAGIFLFTAGVLILIGASPGWALIWSGISTILVGVCHR